MEPLANKIRPTSLDEYVGQKHLVGEGKPLRLAIEQGHIFSFVLWGTPGTGKTTLARIYANAINAEFHELSAVSAGKEDIRKIVNTTERTKKIAREFYFSTRFIVSIKPSRIFCFRLSNRASWF